MKKLLEVLLGLVLMVVLMGAGGLAWATTRVNRTLSRQITTHAVGFPIPFPLPADEIARLESDGVDPERVALDRAVERGRHLVEARYACVECHGRDFGGGVMVDDPLIGRLLGPNITEGQGSRSLGFEPSDWDRVVRHGLRSDGTPALMPSEDFQGMSDQELSDIVAYLRSQPPVDNSVPPLKWGPLGRVLLATGQIPLSADVIPSHAAAHEVYPPEAAVSVEFGRHMAGICMGCHQADFSGGKIPGAPPDWPAAANLTPHTDGLAEWSYPDFVRALREGRRPDGTAVRAPMSDMSPYAANMTDTELDALWMYLRSLPAKPSGR